MRFRVVPAAYVMLLRPACTGGDEVLLQQRQHTGFMDGHWASAAAGHVEAGESVLAAAVREAAEELGVTVSPDELLPITTMHRTQGTGDPVDERVDFFFGCRSWRGEPRVLEPAKSAGLGWFALDALPDPVVPHERAVLDGLAGGALAPIVTFGFSGAASASVPLMFAAENLRDWRGKNVIDPEGSKIGELEAVYVDTSNDDPSFLTVKIGFIARHRLVFVPAAGATVTPDAIRVRYPKKLVQDAPSIDTDGELTAADEPSVFGHYELDYGTAEVGQRRLARR